MCKYKVEDWVGATEHVLNLHLLTMSVPFQGERLGLGLYPGVYMGMAPPVLLGSKFGQILFFFSGEGCRKLALFFKVT